MLLRGFVVFRRIKTSFDDNPRNKDSKIQTLYVFIFIVGVYCVVANPEAVAWLLAAYPRTDNERREKERIEDIEEEIATRERNTKRLLAMEEIIEGQHGDLNKTKPLRSQSVVEARVEKEYQEHLLRINGEIGELQKMMQKSRESKLEPEIDQQEFDARLQDLQDQVELVEKKADFEDAIVDFEGADSFTAVFDRLGKLGFSGSIDSGGETSTTISQLFLERTSIVQKIKSTAQAAAKTFGSALVRSKYNIKKADSFTQEKLRSACKVVDGRVARIVQENSLVHGPSPRRTSVNGVSQSSFAQISPNAHDFHAFENALDDALLKLSGSDEVAPSGWSDWIYVLLVG